MDPAARGRPVPGCRLPRTRGDGPLQEHAGNRRNEAPPHTRGWTEIEKVFCAADVGSPAHAEMDPPRGSPGEPGSRLPRTRGDGPPFEHIRNNILMAPPHTRGWTHSPRSGQVRQGGSPAHAGMDLGAELVADLHNGLPRTRGDGPCLIACFSSHRSAPPHTRGWTARKRAFAGTAMGSPAHAGMDPVVLLQCLCRTWLPRTRGDGPVQAMLDDLRT